MCSGRELSFGLEKLVFQGAGRNNSSETKPEITSSAQKQTMEDAESAEKTNNDSKTNQLLSQNINIQERLLKHLTLNYFCGMLL